jgi:hypothetical protein
MDARRGRTDRDAQRAGRWGGGSAQCAPFSPGHNHSTTTTPCRAPAARRARGAKRERAQAGCSGGASGPCWPGLKTYRKSSPTEGGTRQGVDQTEGRHGKPDRCSQRHHLEPDKGPDREAGRQRRLGGYCTPRDGRSMTAFVVVVSAWPSSALSIHLTTKLRRERAPSVVESLLVR